MKYIISAKKDVIIFPEWLNHRDVARYSSFNEDGIHSAGFCHLHDGQIATSGESISLGVQSKEGDAEIIRERMDYY